MRPASPPPPPAAAVARDVSAFARALVAATRTQAMYGPHHPNTAAAAERCRATLAAVVAHQDLVIGVTPETLLVDGNPLAASARLREAAALLNDRDILRLHIVAVPGALAFSNFLMLLSFEPVALRQRGGPARVWEQYNHPWVIIDQIDFDAMLAGAADGARAVAGGSVAESPRGIVRDETWQSIVRAMAGGRAAIEADAERRLLDIVASPDAIHALAFDAADAQGGSGAAREAAKAAAVLMTFQRLSSFVELQSPSDLARARASIAEAAARTEPRLLMGAVAEAAESGLGTDVIAAIGTQFDDGQVATLLAAAMAVEGKASARMAAALNTLTPDAGRQARILRLARTRARVPGPAGDDLSAMWASLERLLEGPADAAKVSRHYGETLEYAESRANRVRLDAPPKLDEWVRSVSPESVRSLSVTLMLDVFGLEQHAAALQDTGNDLAALTDDLLLAGDATEAFRVVDALTAASASPDLERASAATRGLAEVARCPGLREIVMNSNELEDGESRALEALLTTIGPASIDVLIDAVSVLPPGPARDRVEELVVGWGDQAFDAILGAIAHADFDHTRELVRVVARIGGPRAVSILLTWARGPREDLRRLAIQGLVSMEDPAAAPALSALLGTGTFETRAAAIDAVAGSHHRTASRLLASALADVDPVGTDHVLAIRLLSALRLVGDADAVPAVARAARRWSWLAWTRSRLVVATAVSVLVSMGCHEARAALDEAAADGHRRLRRAARAALRGGG